MKKTKTQTEELVQTQLANEPEDKDSKRMLWIALVLLVLSLALIFQDESHELTQAEQAQLDRESRDRTLKSINHYLQMKHKEQELRAMQVELENRILASHVDPADLIKKKDSSVDYGVEMEQEQKNVNESLREDLYEAQAHALGSIDNKINSKIALQQWVGQLEERQRRAYIRTFLENARADGYEIRLNEDLEVVHIREVEPSRQGRNPQSSLVH